MDGFGESALQSGELIKLVDKNKYQMPNIKELVDTIGQIISERKKRGFVFHHYGFKLCVRATTTQKRNELEL